jgi:glycosyltransferase involved in cell wall biosynthesis
VRIAFVNTRTDAVGGSQVHVRDLAHALRRMGHDVKAFVGGDGPVLQFLADKGVPCVPLRHLVHEIQPSCDARALREACAALAEFRPDVISTHTSKAGVVGRMAARILGVPSIFTAHGWNFTDGIRDCNRGFRVGMERTCARWSARIITVSEADRRLALRHRVAAPSKIQTIHNGMPDVPRALRAEPASGPPRIVMVARFEPQKDHRTFLAALSGLAHLPWEVEFIGGGPLLGEMRELAARLGIGDRVEFAGACNDVTERLARAQVFALVSNWEGLPRSIIEAMRAGLPVVASDVGGTSEMVSPRETGFLVPRGDVRTLREHLATLLTQPGLRSRLGRRGRERYEEQFTFEAMLGKTLRMYEEVVAPAARTRAPAPATGPARRVVHVVESFGAGTAGVIRQLVRGMPEYRHVIVYGRRPEALTVDSESLGPSVQAVEWGGAGREINPLRDGSAFVRLMGILRRLGTIDLVHAHSAKGGFHGRLAARLLGLRRACVYTTHGSPVLRGDVRPWAHRLYRALERVGASLAGTVVACSASEHQILRAAGIDATVICNGVDPGPDRTTPGYPRQPGPVRVGTVARAAVQKDPAFFRRIAEHFEPQPDVRFVWVGGGELAGELNVSNLAVTGWLEEREAQRALSGLDVYVSTSMWEGLSLGVLHAMAAGKPLVLRRCPGNVDVVEVGANGFLFDTVEEAVRHVTALVADADLRRRLGARSRAMFAERFTSDRMVEHYRRLYQSLMPGAQPAVLQTARAAIDDLGLVLRPGDVGGMLQIPLRVAAESSGAASQASAPVLSEVSEVPAAKPHRPERAPAGEN